VIALNGTRIYYWPEGLQPIQLADLPTGSRPVRGCVASNLAILYYEYDDLAADVYMTVLVNILTGAFSTDITISTI